MKKCNVVLGYLCALLLGAACGSIQNTSGDGGLPDGSASTCGTGQVLVNGTCQTVPASCPCPLETYCDLATNSCKVGCTQDGQCSAGRACNTGARQCIVGCNVDRDCTGAGQVCVTSTHLCMTLSGSGTFVASAATQAALGAYAVAAADVNGD